MSANKLRQQNNQKGQVFLEFILLLVIFVTISFGFVRGFQRLVGSRWEIMLQIVAIPEGKTVKLP